MMEILNFLKESPGFAAAISAIGTLAITGIIGLIRENMHRKQRFLDRYFPERIKAYNELLKDLPELLLELAKLRKLTPSERPKSITLLAGRVTSVFYKNRIWFDKNIKAVLDSITETILSLCTEENSLPDSVSDNEVMALLKVFSKQQAILIRVIEISSGIDILDKETQWLIRPSITKRLKGIFCGDKKKTEEAFRQFLEIDDLPE